MDASIFTQFTDLLKRLSAAGNNIAPALDTVQPQAGNPPPVPKSRPVPDLSEWQIPTDVEYDAPRYDANAARQIVNRYVDAGFDPRYAVGMAANAVVESGLNPRAHNKPEGSYGLFQHRDAGFPRLSSLKAFSSEMGESFKDFMSQVDFSIFEKFNNEKDVISQIYNKNPQTASDFAGLIDKYYERSDGAARSSRKALATDMWRRFYGDKQYEGGPTVPTDDSLADFYGSEPIRVASQSDNPFQQLFAQMAESSGEIQSALIDPVAYAGQRAEEGPVQSALATFLSQGETETESQPTSSPPATLDAPPQSEQSPPAPVAMADDVPAELQSPSGGPVNQGPNTVPALEREGGGPFSTMAEYGKRMYKSITAPGNPPNRDPDAPMYSDETTAYEDAERDLGVSPPAIKLDLPELRRPRRTYGEADRLGNEFRRLWVRDKGESDQEVRARRRGMFVQAGEVLQSISLGQKFDAGLGARMNINERNQLFQQDIQYAQEKRAQETLKFDVAQTDFRNRMGMIESNRRERQLDLDEADFAFTRSTKYAEMAQDKAVQAAMVDWAKNNGYEQFVPVIEAGATGVAGDLIKADLRKQAAATQSKQGASAFSIGEASRAPLEALAERVGRQDLLPIIFDWQDNPRPAEAAYKELLDADDTGEAVAMDTERLQNMIPPYLSEAERDRLGIMAGQAARDANAFDDYAKAVQASIDASPVSKLLKQLDDTAFENFKLATTGSEGLERAAMEGLEFATNPAFKGSALGGNVLVPIAKYINSIPGVGEVFEDATGITDVTRFGNTLLDAAKRGQLGNLAQGVTGQLSNLEGQMLLSVLGDGKVTNVEIMALSQAIMKRAERANTAIDAHTEWRQKVEAGEITGADATAKGREKYVNQRVWEEHGDVYKRIDTPEIRQAYMDSKIAAYAEAAGMTSEEYLAQPQGSISRRLLGEVIMEYDGKGGYRLAPLFDLAPPGQKFEYEIPGFRQ